MNGGTPATLLNTMESQLEAVQHRIRKAEDEIVEIKQELTIAKQAGNKGGEEEVKFLRGRLEKLDSRLLSLQEEKNTLLRSQAPSLPWSKVVSVLGVLLASALLIVPTCLWCAMAPSSFVLWGTITASTSSTVQLVLTLWLAKDNPLWLPIAVIGRVRVARV